MIFELTVLGCNSAVPAYDRHPSAQVLIHHQQLYLIDCGESTQFQLRNYQVKYAKIDHIFISHLHGDHYFGLIGLISSFHLNGREKALYIYAPKQLEDIIYFQLKASDTKLRFPIFFIYTKMEYDKVYENKQIEVYTIPLIHRIPTTGFLFKEKIGLRKIDKSKIDQYPLEPQHFKALQLGKDIEIKGKKIENSALTIDPGPPRTYAYCSDTAYNEEILTYIKDADLLYHETTFDQSNAERAAETLHSTTTEAGTIAKKANAKKLMIGHYSSRYKDVQPLVDEAKTVFENTIPAIEGQTTKI
jgi:ribonuclease Z